jgi:hypothetical protein
MRNTLSTPALQRACNSFSLSDRSEKERKRVIRGKERGWGKRVRKMERGEREGEREKVRKRGRESEKEGERE